VRVWIDDKGSLRVGGLVLGADAVTIRATTSGGPGGQHANRSLTKIVVVFDHTSSSILTPRQQELLLAARETPFQASSSTHRSQAQNREAALLRLGEKLAAVLSPPPPRRATKPTKSSVQRRLEGKRHVADRKRARRNRGDD
jgi:ribosome-associated protein